MWNNLVFFWKVRYNKLCQRSGYDDFRNTEEGRDT